MGQKPKELVGPKLGQGEQNPSLDPNLSLPLSLSLSLFAICLRFVLNVVSLGLEESKPHRTPFTLSNLKRKIES